MRADNLKTSRIRDRLVTPWALRSYLVLTLLGAFWGLANNIDFSLLPERVYWAYSPWVAISVFLFWVVLAGVWRFNLRLTIGQQIGFLAAFRQIVMLLMGKYLPGKVWGVFARGGDASVHQQVSAGDSYVAAYLEQLISVHAGVLFGLALLALAYPAEGWIGILFLLALPSLIIVPKFHHSLLRWLVGWLLKKYASLLKAIESTAISTVDYWQLFLAYICEWVVTGLMLVTVQLVISGAWPAGELFVLLVGSYAIAMVVGFVAIFAPGGIGVREGVMVALLAPNMGFEAATILAVVMRLVTVSADLIAGLIAVMMMRRSN